MSAPPFEARLLTVAGREALGAYTLLALDEPDGGVRAGQFAMLAAARGWGGGADERPYLPRAFSLCSRREGRSLYLLEEVGPGTARLCSLEPGDAVHSTGPLGRPFTAPAAGRALLVGGGIGVAPLVLLAEQLPATTVLLGFRDRERARAAELFSAAAIATDDGSVGRRGTVLELLEEELADGPATVYGCGPPAMLEALRQLCVERQTPCQLALEAPMACGFGACWGCAVPAREGGFLRVCVDGPVLDAKRVGPIESLPETAR